MAFIDAATLTGASGEKVEVVNNAVYVDTRSEWDVAVEDGRAYSFASLTYDPDAHDTILAVENNDPDQVLKIKRIIFTSDTASLIQVYTASGVTVAGTAAVVPVPLNRTTGRAALVTAICDETGNTEQGSSYTTKVLQKQVAENTLVDIDVDGAIVLPYDHMVGVDLTTAATGANCTIFGWFAPT